MREFFWNRMQTKVSEPQPSLGLLRDPSCELPPGKRAKNSKAVHLQRRDRVQKEMVMSGLQPFLVPIRDVNTHQPLPGKVTLTMIRYYDKINIIMQ